MRGLECDPRSHRGVLTGRYHAQRALRRRGAGGAGVRRDLRTGSGRPHDELADGVKRHFGEAGLVCLIEALGFIEGRIRLALMFTALGAVHGTLR
jgi:hypothetical protein